MGCIAAHICDKAAGGRFSQAGGGQSICRIGATSSNLCISRSADCTGNADLRHFLPSLEKCPMDSS
ncbi:hypothetical protein [Agathobacter rectalis]|uniref:hypothetical protein n=1 Tax=Agathobacter rectalis TaxID=39491 RepID=UPI0027D28769|nr:hypothetical protein [Agathobacter rectalis]MCB6943745.1 hypothetical protein [Agathobacter rectalis]